MLIAKLTPQITGKQSENTQKQQPTVNQKSDKTEI